MNTKCEFLCCENNYLIKLKCNHLVYKECLLFMKIGYKDLEYTAKTVLC